MDKEEREYYYRVLRWNNKYERMYSSIIDKIDSQLNRYTSYLNNDITDHGRSITESRIKALNSLKITYTKHYNKKKSLLESLGYNVCNEAVYLNDKFAGYIGSWKYIIKNTVDQTDKTC